MLDCLMFLILFVTDNVSPSLLGGAVLLTHFCRNG